MTNGSIFSYNEGETCVFCFFVFFVLTTVSADLKPFTKSWKVKEKTCEGRDLAAVPEQ